MLRLDLSRRPSVMWPMTIYLADEDVASGCEALRTLLTALVEALHERLADRWPEAADGRQSAIDDVAALASDIDLSARLLARTNERQRS